MPSTRISATLQGSNAHALEAHGVEKIYTPEDGRRMGLAGMIDDVFARVRRARKPAYEFGPLDPEDPQHIARTISCLEGALGNEAALHAAPAARVQTVQACELCGSV